MQKMNIINGSNVSTCYVLQRNSQRKPHTFPYVPSSPQIIAWSHFVWFPSVTLQPPPHTSRSKVGVLEADTLHKYYNIFHVYSLINLFITLKIAYDLRNYLPTLSQHNRAQFGSRLGEGMYLTGDQRSNWGAARACTSHHVNCAVFKAPVYVSPSCLFLSPMLKKPVS